MANHSAAPPIAPYKRVAGQTGSILGKYLADRGPHLAAMIRMEQPQKQADVKNGPPAAVPVK